MRALVATAVGLLIATRPALAAAADDAWQVGLGGGYSLALLEGVEPHGPALSASLAYGVTEAWSARVAATTSFHAGQPALGTSRASGFELGATYRVDVLRWVPFCELGAAALSWHGDPRSGTHAGFGVGLGIEYLLNPRWAVTFVLRYHQFPWRVSGEPPPVASDGDLGPRVLTGTLGVAWSL